MKYCFKKKSYKLLLKTVFIWYCKTEINSCFYILTYVKHTLALLSVYSDESDAKELRKGDEMIINLI